MWENSNPISVSVVVAALATVGRAGPCAVAYAGGDGMLVVLDTPLAEPAMLNRIAGVGTIGVH